MSDNEKELAINSLSKSMRLESIREHLKIISRNKYHGIEYMTKDDILDMVKKDDNENGTSLYSELAYRIWYITIYCDLFDKLEQNIKIN